MKRVIREGVFETNSSSTHSVTFKKHDKNKGEFCHFAIVSPLQKIIFLRSLVANSEESYEYRKRDLEETLKKRRTKDKYSKKKLRAELERRVTEEIKRNELGEDFFLAPVSEVDERELVEFYSIFADDSPEKEKFCAYFETVWDEDDREFVLAFLDLAEKEYCEKKGFDKDGLQNEIDTTPVRRCGHTYQNTGKFRWPVNCTRFFGEGALYDCDCGFGSYYEIARELCATLNIDKYRWKEENVAEKVKLFLSDRYCFACKESYGGMGRGKGAVAAKPTDEIL